MPKINLYLIYRKVAQRIRPELAQKSSATQLKAKAMVAAAELLAMPETMPTLKLVSKFRKAEDGWRNSYDVSASTTSMADQFEAAIRSGDYVIERPRINILDGGYNPESGLVYCVRSASKSGQLKIGVTTMKLKERLQKMSTRYGIEDVRPLFTICVSSPAEIEKFAKAKLLDFRVTGCCTKGGSVEWYRASAIEIARAVVDTVEEYGNSVGEVTLFTDCPNTSNVKVALNRLANVNHASWM